MRIQPLGLALAVLVLVSPACSRHETGSAAADRSVVSTSLGLRLAAVPDGLRLASNSEGALVLLPDQPGKVGRIEITVEPIEAGVNLVEAIHHHQAAITARKGASYLGAQELTGPLGSAYWSRGRYPEGGKMLEETRVFTLTPDHSRIVDLTYRYPAAEDSSQRVQKLLDVLGEIEAPPSGAPASVN